MCVDEDMYLYDSHPRQAHGPPHLQYIERKPHSIGVETKCLAEVKTMIRLSRLLVSKAARNEAFRQQCAEENPEIPYAL